MDRFNSLFDSQFVYALGWTIVHSFWQSLLVFTLLAACLLVSQRSRPQTRYWLSMAALVCCLLISIKTFVYCYQDVVQASSILAQLQASLNITQDHSWWVATFTTINPWLDNIVLVWCVGFLVHIMLYGNDIILTQRLRHQSVSNLPEDWNKRLHDLAQKIGVSKHVSFMHSTMVKIPSVIGHFKPVILLPLGILTQLPSAQIEAIVLHELAHIKRHDYLINILQSLVKVLFFYNPFVLAISKKIDIERENICDDLAVKACGDPLIFANSLSQFADVTPISQSAMAANKDKYLLLARVKRLFSTQGKLSTSSERIIALFCAGLLGLTLNVNANSQPTQLTFKPTSNQTTPLPEITEQKVQAVIIEENPVAVEPLLLETPVSNNFDKVRNDAKTAIIAKPAKISKSEIEATPPVNATQKFIPLAEVTNTPNKEREVAVQVAIKPQTDTILLAQQKTKPATSVALDYVDSKSKAEAIKVSDNLQNNKEPKGRVYAETPKFNMFSLESPLVLENIDQLIFAPISTSETQLSSRTANGKRVSSQYFSELQNKQPRVFALDNTEQSTPSLSGLSASLIAQIRIKDVKMYNSRRKNYSSATWRLNTSEKTTGEQRKAENRRKDQNRYKSNPGPDSTDNSSSQNKNLFRHKLGSFPNITKNTFVWDVIVEVVFVDANTYEYAGYAIKHVRFDSRTLEPNKLNQARHSGSLTKAERNADIIKNAWDILIEEIQNDVYLVANAIKNKELELTSLAPSIDTPSIKDTPINRSLAQQYFRIEDSEFDEFVISSPNPIKDYKYASYAPILIDDVQLKSKHSGWKEHAANSLTHITGQTGLTYDLGNNELSSSLQASTGSEENLLVQIEVKSLDFYSRSTNRTYRNVLALRSSGSNYNRGDNAIGLSPSKDDVGGATVRKDTVAVTMPSAFDTKQYLRGQFEITILDPLTRQVLGYVTSETTIRPSHSAYRQLAEQIIAQNLGVQHEDILLLALFEKVKTHLHTELLRIQQGEMSFKPIQLSTEQANSLAENPLV